MKSERNVNMGKAGISDRIFTAISDYVQENGEPQSRITLSERDYNELYEIVASTELGRSFLKDGFYFCTLPVFSYDGTGITIS